VILVEVIFSEYVEDGPCCDNRSVLECPSILFDRNMVVLLVTIIYDMHVP
jgi:hypothetical protein